MGNAFAKDVLRSIRGSLGRFLAIMGIVALGCGFYAGLQMSGPDMRADADAFYDGTNLWDIRLISTLGFADEDVARVAAVEGTGQVMPSRTCDAMARLGFEQMAVRVSTLDPAQARASHEDGLFAIASDDPSYLNRVRLVSGRWPEAAGECVVSADVPHADYGIGDTAELLYGTSELSDLFAATTLTVVGTVASSNYPYTGSFGSTTLGSGQIDQYLFVAPSTLADDAPYTEIYLTVEGAADELSESEAYEQVVDATKARLEVLASELGAARQADLKADAQATLDEKWDEYETERADAERKLADAKAKLDDALREIQDGEAKLADGEAQYRDGLAEYERQRADAMRRLDEGADEIARNQKTLNAKRTEWEKGSRELTKGRKDYEKGLAELLKKLDAKSLQEARTAQTENARQLDEGIAQIEDGIAQIEAGPAQAQAAIDELEARADELRAGIAQADEALAQLPSAEELAGQRAALELALEAASDEDRPALEAQLAQLEATEGMRASAEAGKSQAEEALPQIEAGLAQAQEGLEQATAAQAQLPALQAQLEDLQTKRAQVGEALAGIDQLEAAKATLDASQRQLDDGKKQLDEGQRKLDAARKTLASSRATAETELARAKAKLDDAAAELADARAELKNGRMEYADGRRSYEDAREEADEKFADALAQLEDAQREIDDIELPDIYALDRTQSEGAATYHADSERMDAIASVFPFMFFLVAALVSLTTMTRMVDDERTLIGTYKALGYHTAAIASKYLAYAASAGVVGALVGIVVLSQVLPYIVMRAYSIIYTVPIRPFPLPIYPRIALSAGGLGVGVTLLATWGAVVSSLREVPATLMLPRAPKPGKRILLERIGPVWLRLSFTWKVTCRNLFRYKRRFLMTVIGISGCTALLLVGFGLHDAIWDIIDCNYGPIVHFDTTVGLDDDANELDVRRVCEHLDATGEVDDIVRVQNENMQAGAADSSENIRVNVVIPRSVADITTAVSFRNRLSREELAFDGDSVFVTEKLSIKFGLDVGDEILLFDQDDVGNPVGEGHALSVSGIVENYVGNMVYVGRDAWRTVSDRPLAFSTIYASTTMDTDVRKAIANDLHDYREVSTVIFSDETINTYRTMLSVVDMVVVVLIVSAAALAYIVLFNLTNINIGERIREIASLKVLGFTRPEVYSYIFREIALLAVIGDALGMVLGTFLARFVITTAEVDYVMFGRTIHPPSYAYAFALTLAFAGLVLLSMRHKLDRVDMVESLKSVD